MLGSHGIGGSSEGDPVQALAYCTQRQLLASAGLDDTVGPPPDRALFVTANSGQCGMEGAQSSCMSAAVCTCGLSMLPACYASPGRCSNHIEACPPHLNTPMIHRTIRCGSGIWRRTAARAALRQARLQQWTLLWPMVAWQMGRCASTAASQMVCNNNLWTRCRGLHDLTVAPDAPQDVDTMRFQKADYNAYTMSCGSSSGHRLPTVAGITRQCTQLLRPSLQTQTTARTAMPGPSASASSASRGTRACTGSAQAEAAALPGTRSLLTSRGLCFDYCKAVVALSRSMINSASRCGSERRERGAVFMAECRFPDDHCLWT